MSSDVVLERCGGIGIATLRRPAALNALTLDMVRAIDQQLRAWQSDPEVVAVLLHGAPHATRGPVFCAGADIRFFHAAALAGDPALGDFFTEEFRLDHLIWTYAKPVIALLDGIVMGGGMGLAQGARLRVVTEHTAMAMPEVGIGFFPDVAAGHFLSRCPGRIGEYLGVTGVSIGPGEALAAGLADVLVARASLPAVVEALVDQPMESGAQAVATVLAQARRGVEAPAGDFDLRAIDRHFGHLDMPSIVRSLQSDTSVWAASTLDTLRSRSPLMCAVALEQIRRGRTLSLADDLRMERGMAHHAFLPTSREAVEGIRALAIDKDQLPRWRHADAFDVDAADVDAADVAAYFVDPWAAGRHPLQDLKAP